MSPKIYISIKEKSQKEVLKKIRRAKGKSDLVEICLDYLENPDLEKLLKKVNLPIIVSCKKLKNGGVFKGNYKRISEMLIEAMLLGVEYLEIPFEMPLNLIKKIAHEQKKYTNCQLIFLYQNNQKTPSIEFLIKKAILMKKSGAHIVKIITNAKNRNDSIKMIAFSKMLSKKRIKHMVWANGKDGLLSQLLTPTVGSQLMQATLTEVESSACHLLSIKTLRNGWKCVSEIK